MAQTFHQERITNGILHHREAPGAPWVPYSAEELTLKIEEVQLSVQREISETARDAAKLLKQSVADAKRTATEDERNRIVKVIEGEEELTMDLTSEQLQVLEQMNRVELARVVVLLPKIMRATKKDIKEKVRGI